MMTFQNITTNIHDEVLTITLNRPDKLNALNKPTLEELNNAFEIAEKDSSIAAIIITGAGNKSFVAGADISEFLSYSTKEGKEFSAYGQQVFRRIELFPKPVIAAVNGFALGGGCELAMSCHIRIASDNAKFGQPEVNLGLIPGYGGTQLLIQLIGKGKATELMMTADAIDAQTALNLGLVNYVVGQDQLLPKCVELINKIKSKSPVAVAAIVRCVDAYFKDGVDGFEAEVEEFAKCFGTDDFKEGVGAFLEKRKPDFKNKTIQA